MRRPYWRLLQKEISQALPMFIIAITGMVAWHGFLYTRIDVWPMEAIIGLAVMPIGAIPLWLVWQSISTLRTEWRGNHMYLLLALPIPGWYIASVKVLIVMLEAALYSLVIGGGTLFLASKTGLLGQIPVDFLVVQWGPTIGAIVTAFVVPLVGVVVTQFAYIAGRLTSKLAGLVSGITFVLSMWFVVRVGTLLTPVFRWLPDVPIKVGGTVDGIPIEGVANVGIAPAVGTLLAVFGLFWLGASFLERDVEL